MVQQLVMGTGLRTCAGSQVRVMWVPGTGAGDQNVTCDIPVPVWAGDGYVTGRNTGVMVATSPPIYHHLPSMVT